MQRRPLSVVATAALALALATSGCTSGAADRVTVTAAPTSSAAPATGATLGAGDFAAALQEPDTAIIDVRTPAEYAEGHLPGAVNIDLQSPDFAAQVAGLDPSVPYAVYCRTGNRSQVAIDVMAQNGLTNVYHLGGGIGAWQQAGGEIVTG